MEISDLFADQKRLALAISVSFFLEPKILRAVKGDNVFAVRFAIIRISRANRKAKLAYITIKRGNLLLRKRSARTAKISRAICIDNNNKSERFEFFVIGQIYTADLST